MNEWSAFVVFVRQVDIAWSIVGVVWCGSVDFGFVLVSPLNQTHAGLLLTQSVSLRVDQPMDWWTGLVDH